MPTIKTVELTHELDMRFGASTGTGRRFTFDEAERGGLGPVETVVASLAACSAMDVLSIALKKRQRLVRYAVHARAEQRDDYPQILIRIDLVHDVEGAGIETAAIRRCIELSATRYCPVNAMLSAGATEIHHAFRVVRPGEPVEEGEVLVTGPYRRPDVEES